MLREYKGAYPNPREEGDNPFLHHICEVCGKDEWLTASDAYDQGWDYPPRMGIYGVLSPRTCGKCSMSDTVWCEVVVKGKSLDDLDKHQKEVVLRIINEPRSIMPSVCDN